MTLDVEVYVRKARWWIFVGIFLMVLGWVTLVFGPHVVRAWAQHG